MTRRAQPVRRFRVDATDRHHSHAEACACGRGAQFDRKATIAELVDRGHVHVDWTNVSDEYVKAYAAEMRRVREQLDAIASTPRKGTR